MQRYRRIVLDIQAKIASGEWPPGHELPPPATLAAEYAAAWSVSVSSQTVRRATDILRELGLLYSRRGVAVFVAEKPPNG